MKINGVQIKVAKGSIANSKAAVFGPEAMEEEELRAKLGRVLRAAGSKRIKSIRLAVGCGGRTGLSIVALAKIVAQEIFRYIRQDRHTLCKINIILSSDKDLKIFSKTVNEYLKHIIHKVSQGPFVTVDTIIEVKGRVVLVKRRNPPFGWAIPGGFLDYGESLEAGAAREAKEETGLNVKNLKQFHTYSQPSRDPRFHTVTTVFICSAKGRPKAASDALEAKLFTQKEYRRIKIAFDHRKVLEDYLRLRKDP